MSAEGAPGGSEERVVLFVAYFFPPLGGGGVQRTVKFVKYLRRHGWRILVEPVVIADSITIRVQQIDAAELQSLHQRIHRLIARGIVVKSPPRIIIGVAPVTIDIVQGIVESGIARTEAKIGQLKDQVARLQFVDPVAGIVGVIARSAIIGAGDVALDKVNPQFQFRFHPTRNETAKIFAIGDPNQAIYGFRGSDLRFFAEFSRLPGVESLSLIRNYRTAPEILEAATAVIRRNKQSGATQL